MGNHKILKAGITAAATLFAANTIINQNAKSKYRCSSTSGYFYDWKEGNIYYTKSGSGSPLLLIHNMDVSSSTYEWSKIIKHLSQDHTVYALDILGCGQSDKPAMTYTNYLFVQLVSDFCKDIIGQPTDVVTSADSASFVIMANNMHKDIFNKIIMINPNDLDLMKFETSKFQMFIKNVLFMPLIGTSLYNYYVSENHIKQIFRDRYFSSKNQNIDYFVETYYQAAHLDYSRGRYLYASILCNYTNIDMTLGIKNKENIYIISSTDRKKSKKIIDKYLSVNDKIEITYLENSKLLPQIESPKECLDAINAYLK